MLMGVSTTPVLVAATLCGTAAKGNPIAAAAGFLHWRPEAIWEQYCAIRSVAGAKEDLIHRVPLKAHPR
jgi:hypothetical protein